ncbi:MAG TPA: phage tail tape measure protein [Oligoflexus sp.]|uniref:phage tail tape measure protein n=1 Tax=Oligoflexus sp. TaxID=1971216 RepID=UPI002D2E4EB1|nr:phage tail tape measure protein [Oligoflexus sp.]HYX36010.1 phage tail tape measure protein [Oligoflexus sp.]
MISAAFDSAFKSTFSSADQKIKSLGSTLKGLKAVASDVKGLKEAREAVGHLTTKVAEQRAEFDKAAAATLAAKEALKAQQDKVTAAKEANDKARTSWKALNKELKEAKASLQGAKGETAHLATRVAHLKQTSDEAKKAQEMTKAALESTRIALAAHTRQAEKDDKSLEKLTATEKKHEAALKTTETLLTRSEQAAKHYTESLAKAGHGTEDLARSEQMLEQAIARRSHRMAAVERQQMVSEKAKSFRSEATTHLTDALIAGYTLVKPVKLAAEFEAAMIRVKAMAGANADEYKRLTAEARRLGAETIFSATQVASAQNELATAGFKANDIIRVMPDLLGLADASMSSLATTAEVSAAVLRGFNLDVSEMGRVGDVLTAAFTSSASSLESLGETMKYVAPVANAVGASLEQVAGMSSVLGNVGIKGSQAGTGLRALFLRLSAPPAAARKLLKEMNISTTDAAGNMRNVLDIIHDVNRALEGAGSSKRAKAWKVLAGEEAAATGIALGRSEKSGALQREIRNYELAPTFNLVGKSLVKMPDNQLKDVAKGLGVKFNRALSDTGMTGVLTKAFSTSKGKDFQSKLQTVYQAMKIQPGLGDIKKEELDVTGRKAERALQKLHISPFDPYAGGTKSKEDLTGEISAAIAKLPKNEQLRYVELFFSRTRNGVRELALEFQKAGPNSDKLVQALGKVNSVERARKELSGSALKAWSDFKGDIEEAGIAIGESVLPMLKDLGAWLKPIGEGFGKWLGTHQSLVKKIMMGVAGVVAFNTAIGLAKYSMSGLLSIASGVMKVWNAGTFVRDQLKDRESGTRKALRLAGKGGKKGWRAAKKVGGFLMKHGASAWGVLKKAGPAVLSWGPKIGNAFAAVRTAMMAFAAANPILLGVVAVVALLAAGAYYVYKHWDTIKPKLISLWSSTKTFFSKIWENVRIAFKAAWDFIMKCFEWTPLGALIMHWEPIVNFFKGIYDKARPYIEKLFPSEAKVNIKGETNYLDSPKSSSWLSNPVQFPAEKFKVDPPRLPEATRMAATSSTRSYSQRNAVTVHAQINVEGGNSAPRQVAQSLVGEVRSAFSNLTQFDLFDPVEVAS